MFWGKGAHFPNTGKKAQAETAHISLCYEYGWKQVQASLQTPAEATLRMVFAQIHYCCASVAVQTFEAIRC